MLTQTVAIFRDAYRELNAKRLFWFVLAISGLVVGAFATVGLYEGGFTINLIFTQWEFPSAFNSTVLSPAQFYKMMFMTFGVSVWLTWAASILALISTSSIMPDFISGGAIELTLSKPIGRLRLFLTKYLSGLLFVVLQVTAFAGSAFLLIGIRGNSWEWDILLAIPIVTVFFSYIYCISTLFGLMTRSTIASLLLTALVWVGFYGVGMTENALKAAEIAAKERVEMIEQDIETQQKAIDAIESGELSKGATRAILDRMTLEARKDRLRERRAELVERRESHQAWARWHRGLYIAKTILPKTSETVNLLRRRFEGIGDFQNQRQWEQRQQHAPQTSAPETVVMDDGTTIELEPQDTRINLDDPSVQQKLTEELKERPLWWVVGTSLGFEAVVLLFAGLIFVRRDF